MEVQWWKIKREINRLWLQVLSFPSYLRAKSNRIFNRQRLKRYDRDFDVLVTVFDGHVVNSGKIAIVLTYQKNGFANSVYHTLQYLIDKGYAPLVVLNGNLTELDRHKLQAYSWRFMDRPNFGYDFGGYRDAVRFLQNADCDVKSLVIMNDSVWYPISGDPLFEAEQCLEAGKGDIIGLSMSQVIHWYKDGGFSVSDHHLESYFYLMPGEVFSSNAFRDFWKNYRMSSDKDLTVKNGEIGFSRHMMQHGFKLWGWQTISDAIAGIENLSVRELKAVFEYAAVANKYDQSPIEKMLKEYEDTSVWREKAVMLVSDVAFRTRFDRTLVVGEHLTSGIRYMKKHSDYSCREQRKQFLAALDNGVIASPDIAIVSEIRDLVAFHEINPPKSLEFLR